MTATNAGSDALPALDPNRPSVARMYDYALGGTHNFAADREAAAEVMRVYPAWPRVLGQVRAFVRRATRYLAAEAGVNQFLDLGSGIPTVQNVHEVAQAVNRATRVVYVDIDPMAVVHSRTILGGNQGAICIRADLRDPDAVLATPELRRLLDFTKPVAVLMSAVLHFIEADDEVARIIGAYLSALPPGSHLAVVHQTSDSTDEGEASGKAVYSQRAQPLISRSRQQITSFFDGLEILEPGVVFTPLWRPDGSMTALPDDEPISAIYGYGAVGRKP